MVDDKGELIKQCYAYCEKVNYDEALIIQYANKEKMAVDLVKKYANMHYLLEPQKIDLILQKILGIRDISFNPSFLLFFALIKATSFEDVSDIINKSSVEVMDYAFFAHLNEQLSDFSNKCLRKFNIKIRDDIVFIIRDRINSYVSYMNKINQKTLEKLCYDTCFCEKFDEIALKKFAQSKKMSLGCVLSNAKCYGCSVLKMSEDMYICKQVTVSFTGSYTKYIPVVEALIEANNQNEIIKILDDTKIDNFALLINFIDKYIFMTRIDSTRYKQFGLMRDVISKIKQYMDFIEQRKKESNKTLPKKCGLSLEEIKIFPKAVWTIEFFLETGLTNPVRFCSVYGIKKDVLEKYLKIIYEGKKELFDKYQNRVSGVDVLCKEDVKDDVVTISKIIADSALPLTNGNQKITFDLIDYYMITNVNIEAMKEVSGLYSGLSVNEATLLRKFICSNTSDEIFDLNEGRIKTILETYDEVGSSFDANGNLIKGTGRIITKREKEKIMEFIKDNRIPLNIRTYNTAYRKYLKRTLDFGIKPKVKCRNISN